MASWSARRPISQKISEKFSDVILLDTNVLSELVKETPDQNVIVYLSGCRAGAIFTAAICEAEIRYGLVRLPRGRRRDQLTQQFDALMTDILRDRIIPFGRDGAASYGRIKAGREAQGRPIAIGDAMIAATAAVHGATLVTRNIRDFSDCGIELVDPWLIPRR